MNNIKIAQETIKITYDGKYTLSEKEIVLPKIDYKEAKVYSPEEGRELLNTDMPNKHNAEMCKINVTNEDSFQAAGRFENPFVMNFANAHNPGGGFLVGANAQEEALCRCSTLYASIKSDNAKQMYKYNNTYLNSVESDYMILSPNVCVFRNEKCELLQKPFTAAVITLPAPNRYGAGMFAPHKLISETMLRRIRIVLRIAMKHGYRNLVLGAWGCGAFGNDPDDVSGYFKAAVIDEKYGFCFDEICFAVYGKQDSKNIQAFRNTFWKYLK